jgi:hypothetical protein
MKTLTLMAAVGAAGIAGLGIGFAFTPQGSSETSQARAVAESFFRTIEHKRFRQTCDLLSRRFYTENHVPDKRRCVLGLTVGMSMAPTYGFEITSVKLTKGRAVVTALANGVPGRIVLVREGGELKVLVVQAS